MESKEKLLDSALNLVVKKGLNSLTLKALHEESKLSKSLINYHFPDLKEVPRIIFKDLAVKGQKTTEDFLRFNSEDPEKALSAYIAAAFFWYLGNKKYGNFFLLVYHLAPADKQLMALYTQINKQGTERLHNLLKKNKKYKAPENKSLARSFHSLLVGSLIKMASLNDHQNWPDYVKSIDLQGSILFDLKINSHKILKDQLI